MSAQLFNITKRKGSTTVSRTDAASEPVTLIKPDGDGAEGSSGGSGGQQFLTLKGRHVCAVCRACLSRYMCPRCSISYCSVTCFATHSGNCSELFYRRHVCANSGLVDDDLKTMTTSTTAGGDETEESSSPSAFLESLRTGQQQQQRQQQQQQQLPTQLPSGEEGEGGADEGLSRDMSREMSGEDLSALSLERLMELSERLNNGDDLSLESLTAFEKKAFLRSVGAGRLSHHVEVWEPWWHRPLVSEIVSETTSTTIGSSSNNSTSSATTTTTTTTTTQSLTTAQDHEMEEEKDAATLNTASIISSSSSSTFDSLKSSLKALPSFSSVSSRAPSPTMVFLVADILYAYCRTLRSFNGAWRSSNANTDNTCKGHDDGGCDGHDHGNRGESSVVGNGDDDGRPEEAARMLVSLCPVLRFDARHENMAQVAERCVEQALALDGLGVSGGGGGSESGGGRGGGGVGGVDGVKGGGKGEGCSTSRFSMGRSSSNTSSSSSSSSLFALSFFQDVQVVLSSRELTACALLDARRVLKHASKSAIKAGAKSGARTLKAHARRLWFFLLWAASAGPHHFSSAAEQLSAAVEEALQRAEKTGAPVGVGAAASAPRHGGHLLQGLVASGVRAGPAARPQNLALVNSRAASRQIEEVG